MDQSKLRRRFLTLHGHLFMLGGPVAATLSVIDLYDLHQSQLLTWGSGLRAVVACIAIGAFGAVGLWFTGTRLVLSRTRGK